MPPLGAAAPRPAGSTIVSWWAKVLWAATAWGALAGMVLPGLALAESIAGSEEWDAGIMTLVFGLSAFTGILVGLAAALVGLSVRALTMLILRDRRVLAAAVGAVATSAVALVALMLLSDAHVLDGGTQPLLVALAMVGAVGFFLLARIGRRNPWPY